MAIQFIQQPGEISFAGDPVITKVKTNLTGKQFLQIKMVCKVIIRGSGSFVYSENYSQEVDEDGLATFNVSSTLVSALNQHIQYGIEGKEVLQTVYKGEYTLAFQEVYLDGLVETEGDTLSSEIYKAIPGALTEYERLISKNADTASILGEGRILSRKPAGEAIPRGIPLYVPVVNTVSKAIQYSIQQGDVKEDYSDDTRDVLIPTSLKIVTDELKVGELKVSISSEEGKQKYVVDPSKEMRHFLFINGFGLIESVTAITRDSLDYSIESEFYVISPDIGFKTNREINLYAQPPFASFSMSSGFVSLEWAEWWVAEFVVTRQAWMWQNGRWLPVAIIPEESNKLYDRSKPGLVAVNFTVRYSFAGTSQNSFVQI